MARGGRQAFAIAGHWLRLCIVVALASLALAACSPPGPAGVVEESPAPTFTDKTPDFSPDGGAIVFSSDRNGNDDIWIVRSDGTGLQRLTGGSAIDLDPRFSPDGSLIVYDSNAGAPVPHLWLMDVSGGDVSQLTDDDTRGDIFPAWSPDGDTLAFACGPSPDEYDLCAIDVDSHEVGKLYGAEGSIEWEAAWSPDGKTIAFVSDRDGDYDIYTISASGQDLQRLTDNPGRDADPAWSPDGKLIAFDSKRKGDARPGVYVMRPDGTHVQRLRFDAVTPRWAPDGRSLAFFAIDGPNGVIYRLKLATKEEERISPGL